MRFCFGKERKVLGSKGPKGMILGWRQRTELSYLVLLLLAAILLASYRLTGEDIGYVFTLPTEQQQKRYSQVEPLFHFIHTTSEATFHQRNLRAVESVFFHHPNASVLIHVPDDGATTSLTSDMTEKPFLPLINAGYNVTIQRFQLQTLVDAALSMEGSTIEKAPIDKWMKTQILRNMFKQNWYVDISDLVRLLVVYTQGGLYMDTDIIIVNPVTILPNSIGFVRDGGPGSGVLKFDKGNKFLADCINEYFRHFRSNTEAWGYVGPSLLKRIWRSKYPECHVSNPPAPRIAYPEGNNGGGGTPLVPENPACPFHILWQDVYYPNVDNCFVVTPNTKKKQKHIQENTFIAHTYNQRTKKALETMNITKLREDPSLCNWLYNSFCIFCEEDAWKEVDSKVVSL